MFDSEMEIMEKISLGEDSRLELKAVSISGNKVKGPKRNDLADELAAFANSNSGVVILGVNDITRNIEGIATEKLDKVEAYVREVCNDSIDPPLTALILKITLPDTSGNRVPVIKIEVHKSLFVHKSPGGYFHRLGSSKRELKPDMLARLFQQRSQVRVIRFDEQAVPSATQKFLSDKLWKRFAGNLSHDKSLILNKLQLTANDDKGEEHLTVSAVLMCTESPEKWLKNAFIEAVCYKSDMPDGYYQLDARSITGPLDQQILEGVHFVEKNMKVRAIKNPGRIDMPQYSIRAIFEAIVNAVAHRDYSIQQSKIRLFMYHDRLELYSPGAIANSMTIDNMPFRQATRNELLTSLLSKCAIENDDKYGRQYMMDKRGEGVPIILAESRRLSGKTPEFKLIDDSELLLTIYAAP